MKVWQQDWVAKWALYSPEKTALKEYDTGRSITYFALHRWSALIASHWTTDLGLRRGDRVAILADFCLEYVAMFCAAQKTGIILVPLNYRLAAPEISHILRDCTPALLITEGKYAHLTGQYEGRKQNLNFEDLNSSIPPDITSYTPCISEEDDPVFILYTAGTTGQPKGVKYSHKMLFWNSINTSISLLLNTESRTVNVMPPFHTGGWNVLLTPFLHHGAYTCICRKFDAAVVLELLEKERATIFMGVPTMLQMIAQQEGFDGADFSGLHYIIVGGEPMPIPLIEKYHHKGIAIRQGYGMTEVGPNLTSLHQDDAVRKIGSIGRPNFYVQVRIADEKGNDCQVNEPGELWLKGPMVTPGYLNNPEMTGQAFSADGEWFKTGDMVRQDEEQYLFVVDRIKNMYISGGENVYPAEIEKVLIKLKGVKECTVIGVKDEKWGETGKAFLVMESGVPPYTEEELKTYCRQQLAKFKVPTYFEYLEALPKNDAGKIDKKQLRKMHEQSVSDR
jgi:fatty-acyl-CoA synthase